MTLTRNTTRFVLNYVNSAFSSTLKSSSKNTFQNVFVKRLNSSTCWKCGVEKKHPQIFCEKCNIIQGPAVKDNYFKVFEIEEKFDIDQETLRDKFRKMQNVLHPDRFSNKSSEEQNISAEYSSLLNKAYNNLHVPLKRAEHLLNLRGENIGEDQAVENPSFLMEIMELNEEMENAGEDREKLKWLNAKNKVELEKISKEIDECFKRNDIQAAKVNTIKLKYYNSLSNRINGILRELGETC